MKSKILIHIVKEIETRDNTFSVDEYISDLYVYTKQSENRDVLYLKDEDKLFLIDDSTKTLNKISLKSQQEQMLKFKKMFYNVESNKRFENDQQIVDIEGKGISVNLEGIAHISDFPGIELTANWDAHNLLNTTAMVNIEIDRKEVLTHMEVDINLQGNKIKNKTTIKEFNVITSSDIEEYDYLLDYKIN